MEYYHGIIILVIAIKVVLIAVCCCVRGHRLHGCGSNRRRMVAMDDNAVAAAARARIERRNPNDRISIIGQAEPMGISPPPHLSVKRNRGPPSYKRATVHRYPNRQNRNPHGSFPQGPIARGPYPQDPNGHGSFKQGPHARASYPGGPNAPAPYTLDPNALGLSCLDGNAQALSAPYAPAAEPFMKNP